MFLDDNLSKCQMIFTKLGVCIDIVEIWFGIATGQIPSIFEGATCICLWHISSIFSFPDDNLNKYQWIITKFDIFIDIMEIWYWIANGLIFFNF